MMKNAYIQNELLQLLKTGKFFHKIENDTVTIVEDKNINKKDKLKELRIKNVPYDENDVFMLLFNLEKEITGLSPLQQKSVEAALAFFENSRLKVYLIEMKSSISEKPNDSELKKILKKIEDSISRLYFLFFLFLDNFEKINEYLDIRKFEESKTEFQAVIFYNNQKIDKKADTSSRIYEVFQRKNGILECETIIGRQKIRVKFFQNSHQAQEIFEINFNTIKQGK
ncbi:MAG: hypothetical protein GY795_24985 [Desulfobacterales bacterium]|nr:hypothetical protein [Desulfobacterales bacterium]